MTTSELKLTVKNDLAEIVRVSEAIEAHGAAHGWPDHWVFNPSLVLDELITNVVSYGYGDTEEHEIHITLSEKDGLLVVTMEDDGVAFDPFSEAPAPDLDADLQDREVGGLGVHFAKSLVSEYTYERRDGRNLITLVQRSTE